MSDGRYRAYQKYKATGAAWLESVPESWDVFDGKRIFESCRETALSSDEQLAASQKFGVVPQSLMMELNDAKVMLALKGTSTFRHVEKHDFVISLRSFEGGIEYSAYTGCVSPAYTVLRATKPVVSAFYKHLFKSRPYISALQATTDSLRDGKAINYEQFGAIPLILPPLPEQTQIAKFLDDETAKIDRLIEKQEELIRLLKEKRQAVISHAVTKGLNPHAPLKDSGIEWLGQVPAHWEILRVKFSSTFLTSGPRGWSERLGDTGSLFIQSGDLNDQLGIEYSTAKRVVAGNDAETSRTRLLTGDVVVCITGAKTGNVSVAEAVPEKAFINQHLCLVRPDTNTRPTFLGAFLKGQIGQTYFELSQYGLKQGLSLENVKEAPIARPPLDEQSAIVEHVKNQTAKFDSIIQESREAVTLLQERRTALISAAVTGKIDVRHWRPPAN